MVGLCLGCGGKSPLDARTELADLGIAYTVKAFFQSAIKGDLTVVKLFVDAGCRFISRMMKRVLRFCIWRHSVDIWR